MDIEKQTLTTVRDEGSGLSLSYNTTSRLFLLASKYVSDDNYEFSINDLKAFRQMIDIMLDSFEEK